MMRLVGLTTKTNFTNLVMWWIFYIKLMSVVGRILRWPLGFLPLDVHAVCTPLECGQEL